MGSMKDQLGDTPWRQPEPSRAFDGATYVPPRDHGRLSGQLSRVYNVMLDGKWRTLSALSVEADGTEAAVSARLRDLRKPKYGSHVIERRHVHNGLFEYRMSHRNRYDG